MVNLPPGTNLPNWLAPSYSDTAASAASISRFARSVTVPLSKVSAGQRKSSRCAAPPAFSVVGCSFCSSVSGFSGS